VVIGTCSLHPVHNAIGKGVESLPFDFDIFVNDLFAWFKLSSEILEHVGQLFLRPVASRGLSVEPVCRRINHQYAALQKYFLIP